MKVYEENLRVLGNILEDKARVNKEKVFLYFKDKKITYREINEISNRIANGFLKIGIKKGDHVAVMMANCLECVYTWFGLAKIGAVEVMVNTAQRGEGLKYILNHSDAKVLITDSNFLEYIKFIEDELEHITRVIIRYPQGISDETGYKLRFNTLFFHELFENSADLVKPDLRHTDFMGMIYTSGTTGPSKGVMISYNYWYLVAEDLAKHLRYSSDDILYTCLPLFHANAKCMTIMPALLSDASIVLGERFSASGFWDEIRKYNATAFNALGGMAAILYKQPVKDNDAENPVKIALAIPVPVNIYEDFEKRFNLKIMEGFGLSESGMITYVPYDDPKPGSMGKAMPGYEIKIVDEDDNELPINKVGEIVSRPARPYSMTTGYYKMPEKTLEAFRNLWFHTGDAGYRDKDGFFFFVDRKKDYLRRRGENISSFEVERVINSHPSVRESAVLGIPSELGEDDVKVVIVLKEKETLKYEDLIAFCEKRMAYFMVPRYVEFRESLPKTATDRVEKYKLRGEGITEKTWDREKAGIKVKKP